MRGNSMSSSFVLMPPHPCLSSLYTIQSPISERTEMPTDYISSLVNVRNRLRNTAEILPENAVPYGQPPPPIFQRCHGSHGTLSREIWAPAPAALSPSPLALATLLHAVGTLRGPPALSSLQHVSCRWRSGFQGAVYPAVPTTGL